MSALSMSTVGMTDESQLIALSHEYAAAVRARDRERWASTWTDDARWTLGQGRDVSGRAAIVELWAAAMSRYETVVQFYGSCSFRVEGTTASGCCQLLELSVLLDGSRTVLAGHYDDTYERTSEGWKFASRSLTKYYAGPPDLSGLFAGSDPRA